MTYFGLYHGSPALCAVMPDWLSLWLETKRLGDVTYGTRDDGDLINDPCGFLLEQLLNDEAANIPSACDCETFEV